MAAKFDMNSIRGAGSGLLNEASKLKKAKEMKLIYVLPDQILRSERNKGISISAIQELAESIADVGLLNPIIVKQRDDGIYELVAGERRTTAIWSLMEQGRWEKDRPVKASLFDPDIIELPLSDAEKEDYVRATENAEQRNQTDGDKLLLMRKLKPLYEKMRERGALTGVKTRELLAADMKMGESTVAQFQTLENNGSDMLVKAVIDDKMSISTAAEVLKLEKEEQEEMVKALLEQKEDGSKITKTDILKVRHQKQREKAENDTPSDPGEDPRRINTKVFQRDIAAIVKALKRLDEDVVLEEKGYEEYLRAIHVLERLIVK